jgi:hypothetical protein
VRLPVRLGRVPGLFEGTFSFSYTKDATQRSPWLMTREGTPFTPRTVIVRAVSFLCQHAPKRTAKLLLLSIPVHSEAPPR